MFQHDAYAAFAAHVRAQGSGQTPSIAIQIQRALPELADALQAISSQNIHQSQQAKIHDTETTKFNQILQAIIQRQEERQEQANRDIAELKKTIQYMVSGGLSSQFNMPQQQLLQQHQQAYQQAPHQQQAQQQQAQQQATHQQDQQAQQQDQQQAQQQQAQQQPQQQPHQQEIQDPRPTLPPQYEMRRDLRRVDQLYYEWMVGYQGSFSIQELDRRWGSSWRGGRSREIQFYSLRLEIIKEIARLSHLEKVSEAVAVQRLQQRQDREKCSIDKLCKLLRREARIRKARALDPSYANVN